MTLARKVAYNTIVQIAGRVIGLIIVLVTVNFIANHLIVDGSALKGFGQYSIVFTYISIIGAAADLGLFTLAVREISNKTAAESGRIVGNALGFRILLMIIVGLLILAIYPLLPYDPVVKQGILIGIVIAFSLLFSQVISSIFQANLATDRIVASELLGKIIMAALTIWFLKQGGGLLAVIAANLIGNLTTFLSSLIMARSFSPIPISFDWRFWKEHSFELRSIAVITLLGLVHFKIDALLLTFFKSPADVGLYALAYKLLEIILIIPAIFGANLLPVLTRLFANGRNSEFVSVVRQATTVLLGVGAGLSVVIFILAPWLVIFVTQADFLPAALPLRIQEDRYNVTLHQ